METSTSGLGIAMTTFALWEVAEAFGFGLLTVGLTTCLALPGTVLVGLAVFVLFLFDDGIWFANLRSKIIFENLKENNKVQKL